MSVLLKYLTDEFANKRLIIFAHLMRLNKWARSPQLWTVWFMFMQLATPSIIGFMFHFII